MTDGDGGSLSADEVTVVTNGDFTQTIHFPHGGSVTGSAGTIDVTTTETQIGSLATMGIAPRYSQNKPA